MLRHRRFPHHQGVAGDVEASVGAGVAPGEGGSLNWRGQLTTGTAGGAPGAVWCVVFALRQVASLPSA